MVILKNLFLYFTYNTNIINLINKKMESKNMKGYAYINFLDKEEIKYTIGKRYHSEKQIISLILGEKKI